MGQYRLIKQAVLVDHFLTHTAIDNQVMIIDKVILWMS